MKDNLLTLVQSILGIIYKVITEILCFISFLSLAFYHACTFLFFVVFLFVHFLLFSRLILGDSSLHLGPAIWELSSNYWPRFLFLSRLHASFSWISCRCVFGAYNEAILSICYLTAFLLYEFHRNAGAWDFSKSFAEKGLISYPLLYLVLLVYFLPLLHGIFK